MEKVQYFFYAARYENVLQVVIKRKDMCKSPHPLLVYLGLATINSKEWLGFMPHDMQCKRSGFSQSQITDMIRGIQLYQNYSYSQKTLKTTNIWQNDTVKILKPDHIKEETDSAPLLLVPSLINKSYIFDIMEDRSFLRWMNEHCITTYLLDWGDLVAKKNEKASLSITQLLQEKLCKAIEELAKRHERAIDVLGYCMGGTLLAGGMHIVQKSVRKAVFLASPWDFHSDKARNKKNKDVTTYKNGQQELAKIVRNFAPTILSIIKKNGFLPKETTQSLFVYLSAQKAVQKFIRFSSMEQNSLEAMLFVSTENWLNDGMDLPEHIAYDCIQDWFLRNAPANGSWYVGDHRVDPSKFNLPTLVIAAQKDNLVPYKSAYALYEQISSDYRDILTPNVGHIGLMVGSNAIEKVWNPLQKWLYE